MTGDDPDTVESLLAGAEDLDDPERFAAIAGLAEQINAGQLPTPHDQRVMSWRDKARSAATAANGDEE